MRVRSNSKHSSNSSMEVEKPKLKEETHLSGAYIRSLVKQLSSSRPRDPSNPKPADSAAAEDGRCQDELCRGELAQKQQQQEAPAQAPQAPPHKKQVRRRLHTSKPYQERLLNMAEARREIVTALKFHRASMKQAKEQQQQQQQQSHNSQVALLPVPPSSLDQELLPHEAMDPKINSRVRPLNYTFPSYFNGSPFSPLSCSSPFSYSHPSNITAPVLPLPDNFKIPFPNQPLGLNLNLQGFHDIEASFQNKPQMEPLPSPSSSSSYSYSSPMTTTSSMDVGVVVPSILSHPDQASRAALEYPSSMSLHPVMDDTEMAEIRSIGEQHDMEWNDTVNLVTSAWWSKFLKDMEDKKDNKEGGHHGHNLSNSHVSREVFDMQSCLSDGGGRDDNEGSFFQQQLDSYYHEPEYQQDAALACLDIGELEGWEWLS